MQGEEGGRPHLAGGEFVQRHEKQQDGSGADSGRLDPGACRKPWRGGSEERQVPGQGCSEKRWKFYSERHQSVPVRESPGEHHLQTTVVAVVWRLRNSSRRFLR